MLASISPVGEASRSQRWTITASAYLVGSLTGGAALGLTAGGIGTVARSLSGISGSPGRAEFALVGVAAVLAVVMDRGWLPVRVPSWQRQVDERWLETYRGWVYGAGFGFQLGAGLLTRVPTAAVWLVPFVAAVLGSLPAAVLVGGWFGLVRALPLLATRTRTDPLALQRLHQRLDALGGRMEAVTAAVITAVAAAALMVGVTAAGAPSEVVVAVQDAAPVREVAPHEEDPTDQRLGLRDRVHDQVR